MCQLDAIVLCTTSKEIENRMVERFFSQLTYEPRNKVDLLIFTNNDNYNKKNILFLNQLISFKSVKIINVNIPPKDDLYQLINPKTNKYIPPLGYLSGPNIMFFRIMDWCKKYDTILLLETDCIIKKNMIQICKTYIESLDNFFISGSYYHGNLKLPNNIRLHLNGVAFYRTGSPAFQEFISKTKSYIETRVTNGSLNIAYDTSIYEYIITYAPSELHTNYITNDLIVNFSPSSDKNIDINTITNAFPRHMILHKKS